MIQVESIADHPEVVETLGRWHWAEWGHLDPEGSERSWTKNLASYSNRDRIPTMYVALEGEELLGSVTLNECDMTTRRELSPWLSGVYVHPKARGRGAASALIQHAIWQAAQMGVTRIYLYTRSARGLYERLGWRAIENDWYEGRTVTIMAIDLTDDT